MTFYRTSELMLTTLIQRYDKKENDFDPVHERETNWNFTGCQVHYFMIVLILFKPFLDNKMSIFEECGVLKRKDFAHSGSKSFLFWVDPFSEVKF